MRRILLVLLLSLVGWSAVYADAPDFAYPQTVCSNARASLRSAASRGDMTAVMQSAMALVIASDDIDAENMPQMVQFLDSLAQASPVPFRQMLYSVKAQLLTQVFDSNRDKASATLSADTVSANPLLWSTEQYYNNVQDAVRRSLDDGAALADCNCNDYRELLTCDGSVYYPSLYSVLSMRGLNYISPFLSTNRIIPFGQEVATPRAGARSLTDSICSGLISRYSNGEEYAAPLCMAYITYSDKVLKPKQKYSWLRDKYAQMCESPYSTELLWEMAACGENADSVLPLCRRQIERFPDYPRIGILKGYLERKMMPEVVLDYPSRLPGNVPLCVEVKLQGDWEQKSNDSEQLQKCNLLLYRLPEDYKSSDPLRGKNGVLGRSKLISSLPLPVAEKSGAKQDFGTLPIGSYFVVPSEPGKDTPSPLVKRIEAVTVSNLSLYSGNSTCEEGDKAVVTNKLWLVHSANGKPIPGAKLQVEYKNNNKITDRTTLTTDKDGCVTLPVVKEGNVIVKGMIAGEKLSERLYARTGYTLRPDTSLKARIYTDLGLYHPGDTLRYAVIFYRNDRLTHAVQPGIEVEMTLRDASGNEQGAEKGTTDSAGRMSGYFVLPKTGMAGRYLLRALVDGNGVSGYSVPVENYALPTFFVETEKMPHIYNVGDTVDVCGNAKTYSGMPVGGAEVTVNIAYRKWKRGYASGEQGTYSAKTLSDANGAFSLKLPTDRLKETEFASGYFNVQVKVTDAAGESQSTNTWFSMGSKRELKIDVPERLLLPSSGEYTFRVETTDTSGRPIIEDICYEITGMQKEVLLSGRFESPNCNVNLSSLPSGKYSVRFVLCADTAVYSTGTFILWRRNDAKPPITTELWVPQERIKAEVGAREVSIPVGSSYPDSYILCVVSPQKGKPEYRWIRLNAANTELRVKAPAMEESVKVELITWRDARFSSQTVRIDSAEEPESMQISLTTFRDKITAGSMQDWCFTLSLGDKPVQDAAALVTLSNRALQGIAPFSWNTPFNRYYDFSNSFSGQGYGSSYNLTRTYDMLKLTTYHVPEIDIPDIYMWDRQLYNMVMTGSIYYNVDCMMGAPGAVRKKYASRSVNNMAAAKGPDTIEEVAETEGDNEEKPQPETPQLRDAVVPLAYFNPTLTATDSQLKISFRAPDANTTWQMQLLAYTPLLQSALLVHDIESSKPLMVQGNFPRFVRVADHVQLRATIYNNTDSLQQAQCRFEIFNPSTGEILKSADPAPMQIDAMQSAVAFIDFDVPDSEQLLGVRVYAGNKNFTDGEQTLLSVMPSSSAVVEAVPFYLMPTDTEYSVEVRDLRAKDGRTTLIYCDNPVWSCLTALPAVNRLPSDASLSSRLFNLFSVAASSHLLQKYPQAADSVRSWTENHSPMLVSQLQKNEELKLRMLSQTPWGDDAQSQNMRMERLYTLLDLPFARSVISEDVKKILELQNGDGGFSWCPGMPSSAYMTQRFIRTMGRLSALDAMPQQKDLHSALEKSVKYCDDEWVSEYNRNPGRFDYSSMLSYLYERMIAGDPKCSKEFASLRRSAIQHIAKNWKKLDIYDAATAAMLLQGYEEYYAIPAQIMESLRQRAVLKPGRGMYYANLQNNWSNPGQLLTTTHVLQAYYRVDPKAPSVDLLRQWLLLQRQGTEWGNCPDIPEVLFTLLQTGSDWTAANAEPTRIYLGDKLLVAHAGLEEYLPLTVDGTQTLRIVRTAGHPSWGAVVENYIAPSDEVKRFSVPDLSITKSISSPLSPISYQVGQTVRVRITVTAQRDMDYVLINDPLAACMQPVSQLSGYRYDGGMFGYQENGKDFVARYIRRLPRGTHIWSYDCYITQEGTFTLPVATVQSRLAPQQTAHTEGGALEVRQ